MEQGEGQPDELSGSLYAHIVEATDGLTPPISPQSVVEAISRAITDYSAATEMPEIAEKVARNEIPRLLGGLSMNQTLKREALKLWRRQAGSEMDKSTKLPRKTKKAFQKARQGRQLGQRELARLQALREQEFNERN
jgi:hypothetical protein